MRKAHRQSLLDSRFMSSHFPALTVALCLLHRRLGSRRVQAKRLRTRSPHSALRASCTSLAVLRMWLSAHSATPRGAERVDREAVLTPALRALC